VPTFCAPFGGPEICAVAHPDEVAYFRCRLRTDVFGSEASTRGIYLEVEVIANPDNLSMAVVDFEAGGCSSVTFSPDTGAVIRERKVREAPRKVEGAYTQPLPTVAPGKRFHGLMGLYLRQGHLAFFRRCSAALAVGSALPGAEGRPASAAPAAANGAASVSASASASAGKLLSRWETTGFVSDLAWAEGRCLTPCLAFRDEGAYRVRVVRVGPDPPIPLDCVADARAGGGDQREVGWSGFDWEVGAPAAVDGDA